MAKLTEFNRYIWKYIIDNVKRSNLLQYPLDSCWIDNLFGSAETAVGI